jgi:hypothetical protein
MSKAKKRLTDILATATGDNFRSTWNATEAADEFEPLPPGEYEVRVLSGELFTSKRNGTPGYKLTLEVTEGDLEGRRLWLDFWLTAAALPMAKRDLQKLGVVTPEQLEEPLPPGILLRVKVVLRRDDDGNEANRVSRFEFIGVEPGDAFEPKADADTSFEPPANTPADAGAPLGAPNLFASSNGEGPYGGDKR